MAILKAGYEPLDDLADFLGPFANLVRRPESVHAMERYTTGLVSDLSRKTASDIGRSVAGTNGQRLQEFLTRTSWDSKEMDRLRVQQMVERASVGEGVQIIDDTGFAKKGSKSVGVSRQYSGTLGRVDNCQVLVTTHYVDRVFDWPVVSQLYVPESWTEDKARCEAAQVPSEVEFKTKGEIALELIDEGIEAGVPTRAVVADAGYGDQPSLLDGLESRGLPYAVGVASNVHYRVAWEVDEDPGDGPPPAYQGIGRPRRAETLADRVPSRQADAILDALPDAEWSTVSWREGTKGSLVKRCAGVRVHRVGLRGAHLNSSGWLIGERAVDGNRGETKYYFVWGLDDMELSDQVELVHSRWVIERFYQDAKGELGLDDYEGRLWTGFHRHVALVMLAHCYLALRQAYGSDLVAEARTAVADGERTTPRRSPTRGFPPSASKKHGSLETSRP